MVRRSAFSLVEVIVVVVILGIAAAVVVPRMTSATRSSPARLAERVAEVMGTAATRNRFSAVEVSIVHDTERRQLRLEERAASSAEWVPSRITPPLDVSAAAALSAAAGVIDLGTGSWRLEFPRSGPRPAYAVSVRAPDGREYPIVLAPTATVALSGDEAQLNAPIDLDAVGRGRDAW